jgi:hypothetical protein
MTRRNLDRKLIKRIIELKAEYDNPEWGFYALAGDAPLARMLQIDRDTINAWRKDGTLPERFLFPGNKRPTVIYQQFIDQDGNPIGRISYDLIKVVRLLAYQLVNMYPEEYEQTLNEMQSA